jgi:hypothetical protein
MPRTRRPLFNARALAALVAGGLTAAVLAACGGDVTGSGDAASTGSPASPGSTAAAATEPTEPVWGFIRSDVASPPVGTPQTVADGAAAGSWQAQPESAAAKATVRRQATGRYTVTFPGIGVPGGRGAAVVTPVAGQGSAAVPACHVVDWKPSGADEELSLECRSVDGSRAPVDSAFTAMFTFAPASYRPAGGTPYAYFRDDQPGEQVVTPANHYSIAGPTGTIKINRVGEGHYTIDLIGEVYRRTGNNLQVNAIGETEAGCNALGREVRPNGQAIFVGCAVGAAWKDTPFVVVYTNQHAMLPVESIPFGHAFTGIDVAGHAEQAPIGPVMNTWERYSANSSGPMVTVDGKPRTGGPTNRVRHLAVGSYQVTFPGVGRAPDHVQVTPYGEPTARCAIGSWVSPAATAPTGDVTVSVRCVNPQGQPVDSYASVAYVSAASR